MSWVNGWSEYDWLELEYPPYPRDSNELNRKAKQRAQEIIEQEQNGYFEDDKEFECH